MLSLSNDRCAGLRVFDVRCHAVQGIAKLVFMQDKEAFTLCEKSFLVYQYVFGR